MKSGKNTYIVTDSNEKALSLIKASGITDASLVNEGSKIHISDELSREKNIVKLLVNNDNL